MTIEEVDPTADINLSAGASSLTETVEEMIF
jgi:hypothetical protein